MEFPGKKFLLSQLLFGSRMSARFVAQIKQSLLFDFTSPLHFNTRYPENLPSFRTTLQDLVYKRMQVWYLSVTGLVLSLPRG